MPEGDSIHRIAARFQVLVGEAVELMVLPRKSVSDRAYAGRHIVSVEARGKNLLVHFEGGVSLRSHLQMNGSWRLTERTDQSVGKPRIEHDTVVFLRTPRFDAECRHAPIAELVRTRDLARSRDAQIRTELGELGIDILGSDFDPLEAARRWKSAAHPTVAETLLDQRLVAGIGNEWKSELLFVVRTSPFAPAADVSLETLAELARQAQRRMRINVDARPRLYPIDRVRSASRVARTERKPHEGPVSVYGRAGEPCYECKTRIEMKRHGAPPRSTYFCPRCQRAT